MPAHPARQATAGSARRPDAAVSTIVGTLLITAITVVMAVALADFVRINQPETTPGIHVDLGTRLDAGTAGWDTGDERVILTHRGGQPLHANATRILVSVAGTTQTHTAPGLGHGFADGQLTIGETWNLTLSIPADSRVTVDVVDEGPPARAIASADLRSGELACPSDTTPPKVLAWSQSPTDLDTGHTGAVTVTLTAKDTCPGLDTTIDPHLWYLVDEGTGGSFADAGAMTQVGGASWQGQLPAPAGGWSDVAGAVLTYRTKSLTDLAGNALTSANRTDTIEAAGGGGGTLTYATDHLVFSGALTGFPALQNASDGGAEATLTEAATGGGQITSEIYGTAHSSSGAQSPGNTTGSPDDGHATLPSDNDWVGVKGFNTFAGTIRAVELGFEGHATGSANGAEDTLELSYEVSGTGGSTSASYTLTELGTSDGAPTYLNVTSDRAWTWADIGNVLVRADYAKQQSEDAADLHVDALWLRVTYDDPGYNATAQVNITGLPSGDHTVEMSYRVTNETFHVQVWNTTQAAWVQRGLSLGQTQLTNWTLPLAPDEVATGTVELRLLDDSQDPEAADSLHIEHLRVRTT